MSRLRVEKVPVRVRLGLATGAVLEGEVFVSPVSPRGSGPQEVWELVDEADPVLAFRSRDGEFCLVGAAQVAMIEREGPAPMSAWTRAVAVRVELAGGHAVAGDLLLEAEGRPVDALRAPGAWLSVRTGGRALWVRKAHLVVVRFGDEGPPPPDP